MTAAIIIGVFFSLLIIWAILGINDNTKKILKLLEEQLKGKE